MHALRAGRTLTTVLLTMGLAVALSGCGTTEHKAAVAPTFNVVVRNAGVPFRGRSVQGVDLAVVSAYEGQIPSNPLIGASTTGMNFVVVTAIVRNDSNGPITFNPDSSFFLLWHGRKFAISRVGVATLAAKWVMANPAEPASSAPFLMQRASLNPGLSQLIEEAFQVPSLPLGEVELGLTGKVKVSVPVQPLPAVTSITLRTERGLWVADGALLHSTNDGRSWSQALDQSGVQLIDVSFDTGIGEGFAWGYEGQNGVLFSTHDGGITWSRVTPDVVYGQAVATVTDVEFASTNKGWMIGYDANHFAAAYTTQDGGITWSEHVLSCGSNCFPAWIVPQSNSTAWIVTSSSSPDAGMAFVTRDGGASWQTSIADRSHIVSDLTFSRAGTGWAVGELPICPSCKGTLGTIWSTHDGGRTWASRSSPYRLDWVTSYVGNTWVLGGTLPYVHGTNMGNSGVVLFTSNGGRSWRTLWQDPAEALYGGVFTDPQDGWALGLTSSGTGVLLSTVNGGAHWTPRVHLVKGVLGEIIVVK